MQGKNTIQPLKIAGIHVIKPMGGKLQNDQKVFDSAKELQENHNISIKYCQIKKLRLYLGHGIFHFKESIKGLKITYKDMRTGQLIELEEVMCRKPKHIKHHIDYFFKDGEFISDGYVKHDKKFVYKFNVETNLGQKICVGHGGKPHTNIGVVKTKGSVIGLYGSMSDYLGVVGFYSMPFFNMNQHQVHCFQMISQEVGKYNEKSQFFDDFNDIRKSGGNVQKHNFFLEKIVIYVGKKEKQNVITGIQSCYNFPDNNSKIQTASPLIVNDNLSDDQCEFFFKPQEYIIDGYFFAEEQVNKIYFKTNLGQEINIGTEFGIKEDFPKDFLQGDKKIIGFFGGIGDYLHCLGFYYNTQEKFKTQHGHEEGQNCDIEGNSDKPHQKTHQKQFQSMMVFGGGGAQQNKNYQFQQQQQYNQNIMGQEGGGDQQQQFIQQGELPNKQMNQQGLLPDNMMQQQMDQQQQYQNQQKRPSMNKDRAFTAQYKSSYNNNKWPQQTEHYESKRGQTGNFFNNNNPIIQQQSHNFSQQQDQIMISNKKQSLQLEPYQGWSGKVFAVHVLPLIQQQKQQFQQQQQQQQQKLNYFNHYQEMNNKGIQIGRCQIVKLTFYVHKMTKEICGLHVVYQSFDTQKMLETMPLYLDQNTHPIQFQFKPKEFIMEGSIIMSPQKLEQVIFKTNLNQVIKVGGNTSKYGNIYPFNLRENKGYLIGFCGQTDSRIRRLSAVIRKYG